MLLQHPGRGLTLDPPGGLPFDFLPGVRGDVIDPPRLGFLEDRSRIRAQKCRYVGSIARDCPNSELIQALRTKIYRCSLMYLMVVSARLFLFLFAAFVVSIFLWVFFTLLSSIIPNTFVAAVVLVGLLLIGFRVLTGYFRRPSTIKRRKRKYENTQAQSQQKRSAAEARFITRHSDLIATLKALGHSLFFTTQLAGSAEQVSWVVTMRCERCGGRYRGRQLSRRWRLSPERPCTGELARGANEGGLERTKALTESDFETRWMTRNGDLIATLEAAGHSLGFATTRLGSGDHYITVMYCQSCGERHRGRLHRWWGLSPKRRCASAPD